MLGYRFVVALVCLAGACAVCVSSAHSKEFYGDGWSFGFIGQNYTAVTSFVDSTPWQTGSSDGKVTILFEPPKSKTMPSVAVKLTNLIPGYRFQTLSPADEWYGMPRISKQWQLMLDPIPGAQTITVPILFGGVQKLWTEGVIKVWNSNGELFGAGGADPQAWIKSRHWNRHSQQWGRSGVAERAWLFSSDSGARLEWNRGFLGEDSLVADGNDSLVCEIQAAIWGNGPSAPPGGAASGRCDAYAYSDPIVRINPLVEVNGEPRPWRDYATLSASGIRVVETDFALWNNPAGGSFETVGNWATWDEASATGQRLPEADAEVEFGFQVNSTNYAVTAAADRALSKLRVCDSHTSLDLAGRVFSVRQLLEVGGPYPDPNRSQSLTFGNGTMNCAGAVEVTRGNLTLQQGANLNCAASLAINFGTLAVQQGAVLTSAGINLATEVWEATATSEVVIDGGSLRTSAINFRDPRVDKVRLNSGELRLTSGGTTTFLTPFDIGNGSASARLKVDGGQVGFSNGLNIPNRGTLELVAGLLSAAAITKADGGQFVWTGGQLSIPAFVVGQDGLLGNSDLALTQHTLNGAAVTVRDGYLLSVQGGSLWARRAPTLEAGSRWEYNAGKIYLASGELQIGDGGLKGPGGSSTIALTGANDEIFVDDSQPYVRVGGGHTLALAAGKVRGALDVQGVLDYGGPGGQPGQGKLQVFVVNGSGGGELGGGGEPGLRIGAGAGAVINGRETVKIGSQGLIEVWGSMAIDSRRTLEVHQPSDGLPNLKASGLDVLGTLRLDGGIVEIAAGGELGGPGTVAIGSGGRLEGSGTILGSLLNEGILSPGMSPGTVHLTGNFEQPPGGWLTLEIAGPTDFDQLLVDGNALLGGTIQIAFLNGYQPGPGESWPLIQANSLASQGVQVVMSGATAQYNWSSNGLTVSTVPEPGSLTLLAFAGLGLLGYGWRRRRS